MLCFILLSGNSHKKFRNMKIVINIITRCFKKRMKVCEVSYYI